MIVCAARRASDLFQYVSECASVLPLLETILKYHWPLVDGMIGKVTVLTSLEIETLWVGAGFRCTSSRSGPAGSGFVAVVLALGRGECKQVELVFPQHLGPAYGTDG